MEAPKRIWASDHGNWYTIEGHMDVKYIRSDLVDKLIGYAVHAPNCDTMIGIRWSGPLLVSYPCTCGLSDLITEVRG